MGSYRLLEGGIEIRPGPDSYHSPEPATIRIREGKVEAISSKTGDLEAYELEPQMITSLFDAEQRSKRQLVKYDDIPKIMVNALLDIEERWYFQYGCLKFFDRVESMYVVTHT